ncbi:DUF2690 domain-containing protein [Streptomyces sp. NPDC005931]|uniref:DUF2690 domain-containing protein n=1 Tax=Streptomyces sp. NPDC005931 TaxID=3364737 RepID=UPI00369C1AC0
MRFQTRTITVLAAAALAAGGLTAASGTPAAAAATGGCYASGCEGKDPSQYCASDATTPVSGVWLGQAYVELRYSPSCRAAWARISHAGYDTRDQFTPYATVHRNSDGKEYTCWVPQGGSGCYTRMVNDANVSSFAKGMWDSGARIYEGRTASY